MSNTPETDAHQSACLRSGGRSCDGGRNAYWLARKLERQRNEVREQRDRLAYALFMCRRELVDVLDDINKERVSHDGDDFHEALRISKEALAAVEGGQP